MAEAGKVGLAQAGAAAWEAATTNGETPLDALCNTKKLSLPMLTVLAEMGLDEDAWSRTIVQPHLGPTTTTLLHILCDNPSVAPEQLETAPVVQLSSTESSSLWTHAPLWSHLNPLLLATQAKKVARVEALVGMLCNAPDLVLRIPTLRHCLRALFETGLGAQAVRLLREGGLRTVPSLADGLVPDVDPALGYAAASGTPQVQQSNAFLHCSGAAKYKGAVQQGQGNISTAEQ